MTLINNFTQINNGVVSTNNSSQTPLVGGAAFTGTADTVTEYASIIVSVFSDVASAANGLSIQFKIDGVWRESDAYTVPAATFKTYAVQTVASQFRVVYTNGATGQATFELQTQYKKAGGVQNSHRIADDVSGQDDAILNKTILAAERPGAAGVYTNIQATNGGNLKVSLEEVESTVIVPAYIADGVDGTLASVEARSQTPTKNNALQVQIGPGDVISNIPVIIDYGHHQVHEGETYTYCNLQTGGLNSGSSYDVRLKSPNLTATTKTPHMLVELIADGSCEAYLHETVTWTSGGTGDTAIYNRNRNSTNTAGMLIYVNGGTALTVNSTGTLIFVWFMPTGATRTATGDRALSEIDLKTNTEYMLRVTSRATGLKFLIRLTWYEDLGV